MTEDQLIAAKGGFTPAAERLAAEEPTAFAHEHGRLYAALETAAQLAELAGHDYLAESLRIDRHEIHACIAADDCSERQQTALEAVRATFRERPVTTSVEMDRLAEVTDGR